MSDTASIAVGITLVVILAVLIVVLVMVTSIDDDDDAADVEFDFEFDDLFELAASLHKPTCVCWDCHVRLVDEARRAHEADQLDAQFEQSKT